MVSNFMNALLGAWPVLLIALCFIPIARAAFGLVGRAQGYNFAEQAIDKDNPAILLRFAGMLFGTLVAFVGIIHPTGFGWEEDVKMLVQNGLLAIGAIIISGWVNDKLILPGVDNTQALLQSGKVSVGIVECATYTATGLIFASAVGGPLGGLLENLGWFVAGQVLLIVLSLCYRVIVRGGHQAIYGGNVACAFGLGGFLLSGGYALSVAIGHAHEMAQVPLYMGTWLLFMVVIELLLNFVIIPGHRMRSELVKDNNWGVGLVNALVLFGATFSFVSFVSL